MRRRIFLGGIAAITLVLVLLAAGCSDSVSYHSIGTPDVQAVAVTGGVMLSWNPVTEAKNYEVWRSEKDKSAVNVATVNNPANTYENGVIYYFDIANYQNEIKSNTEYTYTVYSVPTEIFKEMGKREKKVITGVIPVQGSEANKPTLSDPVIDFGNKIVTITVTPPASGNIPNYYDISFYDGNYNGISKTIRQGTSAPIVLTEYVDGLLIGGTYTVNVTAGIYSNNNYYNAVSVTKETKVDPLFSGNISGNYGLVFNDDNSVTGFYASLTLNSFKVQPGVTYTFERATVDENNELGNYISVNLTNQNTSTFSFIPDVLGNLTETTAEDRTLPLEKKTYRYRIKAVKGDITDYVGNNYQKWVPVNVDPSSYLTLYLNVGNKTTADGNDTFPITASVSNKGLLPSGDKVVLYWKRNVYSDSYSTANSISFTKTDIEAATVKNDLSVSSLAAYNDYIYIQVWWEKADGTKSQISNISGNISNYNYYYDNAGNRVYRINNN
jgi:hypothetical protein